MPNIPTTPGGLESGLQYGALGSGVLDSIMRGLMQRGGAQNPAPGGQGPIPPAYGPTLDQLMNPPQTPLDPTQIPGYQGGSF